MSPSFGPEPPRPDSGRGLGLVLVLATALISGVSTFVNLYAVQGTSSDAFVTVRNVAVALALVPVALLAARPGRRPLGRGDLGRLIFIGIVGGGIPFLLFFHGLELATAAGGGLTASFLYRTLFSLATLFGIVVLGERLRGWVVLAGLLVLGGNLLLLSLTSAVWTDGSGLVLLATLLWAVEYTVSKRALRDLPSPTVALGRMGFGALFLVGYLAGTGQLAAVGALGPAAWSWVGVSAVLLTGFVVTWYAGLERVELGTATTVLVLGFPVTWLLAVAIRGAPFLLVEALGAVTVALGVLLAVGADRARAAWDVLRSGAYRRPTA